MKQPFLQQLLLFIFCTLLLNQCKKEEFVNLEASLRLSSAIEQTITEGRPIEISLALDKKLSEDLLLTIDFSTEGIVNYINENDYSTTIEVKAQGEKYWRSYPRDQVVFPAKSKTVTLRIPTHDDAHLEITEQLHITLNQAAVEQVVTLENSALPPLTIKVEDNDMKPLQYDHNLSGGLMVFAFDDNYTPTLIWVRPTIDFQVVKNMDRCRRYPRRNAA